MLCFKFLIIWKTVIFSALRTSDLRPDNSRTLYVVQSNEGPVTLRCPYEPGSLTSCYYGEWRRGSTPIVRVGRPRMLDCEPGRVEILGDPEKYSLDRETFSLSISSLDANTDSGDYQCRLSVLNPASPIGSTLNFEPFITLSLTVDGKLRCLLVLRQLPTVSCLVLYMSSILLLVSCIIMPQTLVLTIFIITTAQCTLHNNSRFEVIRVALLLLKYFMHNVI